MRRMSLLVTAAAVVVALAPRPAAAQSFRMTFMTLLHPPPDIKFSMRLIIVPPCKR